MTGRRSGSRRLTASWVALVLATLLSGWLAETSGGAHWVAVVIILVAAVKILLVMAEFMELRTAPIVWRCLPAAWLAVVTGLVLISHLVV